MTKLLDRLPENFSTVHFIASADEQTAETVKMLLLSEEARLGLITVNEALFTGSKSIVKLRKSKKQFVKKCFGCGEVSHFKRLSET